MTSVYDYAQAPQAALPTPDFTELLGPADWARRALSNVPSSEEELAELLRRTLRNPLDLFPWGALSDVRGLYRSEDYQAHAVTHLVRAWLPPLGDRPVPARPVPTAADFGTSRLPRIRPEEMTYAMLQPPEVQRWLASLPVNDEDMAKAVRRAVTCPAHFTPRLRPARDDEAWLRGELVHALSGDPARPCYPDARVYAPGEDGNEWSLRALVPMVWGWAQKVGV